ncbi:hypothetical protein ABK040_010279 [Willaertia magna]
MGNTPTSSTFQQNFSNSNNTQSNSNNNIGTSYGSSINTVPIYSYSSGTNNNSNNNTTNNNLNQPKLIGTCHIPHLVFIPGDEVKIIKKPIINSSVILNNNGATVNSMIQQPPKMNYYNNLIQPPTNLSNQLLPTTTQPMASNSLYPTINYSEPQLPSLNNNLYVNDNYNNFQQTSSVNYNQPFNYLPPQTNATINNNNNTNTPPMDDYVFVDKVQDLSQIRYDIVVKKPFKVMNANEYNPNAHNHNNHVCNHSNHVCNHNHNNQPTTMNNYLIPNQQLMIIDQQQNRRYAGQFNPLLSTSPLLSSNQIMNGYFGQPGKTPIIGQERAQYVYDTSIIYNDEYFKKTHIIQSVKVKQNALFILLEDDPIQYHYQPHELQPVINEHYNQRRVEYLLIETYVQLCKQYNISPLPIILDIYTEHIKKGKPVVKLDLMNQNFNDDDLKMISYTLLQTNFGSSIRRLDISGSKITGRGIQYLYELLMVTNNNVGIGLKELDLSGNQLLILGAKYLSFALLKNTTLTFLNLSNTGIQSNGCDLIINSLIQNVNSSIIKLDLRFNNVSENQIQLLFKLAQLRKSICFVEIYPPTNIQENNDGWLSYEGWVNYSLLREVLEKNIDYMKNNPAKLQQKARASLNQRVPTNSTIPSSNNGGENIISTVFNSIVGTFTATSNNVVKKTQLDDTELSFDNDIFSLSVGSSLTQQPQVDSYLKLGNSGNNDLEENTVIECPICYEQKKAEDGIYIMDNCNHKFCSNCIYEYVKDKILTADVDNIKCLECDRQLSVDEVKQILNQGKLIDDKEDLFEKFEEFSLKRALGGMKDLIWCPNPKCGNAIIIESPTPSSPMTPMTPKFMKERLQSMNQNNSVSTNNIGALMMSSNISNNTTASSTTTVTNATTTNTGSSSSSSSPFTPSFENDKRPPPINVHCTHCSMDFCARCLKKWHQGISCEENELRNRSKQDELFKQWIQEEGAKTCPNCGIVIQKTRGCNSMKCSNCKTKFCYFCGKAFTSSEREHYKNCYKWSLFGFNL